MSRLSHAKDFLLGYAVKSLTLSAGVAAGFIHPNVWTLLIIGLLSLGVWFFVKPPQPEPTELRWRGLPSVAEVGNGGWWLTRSEIMDPAESHCVVWLSVHSGVVFHHSCSPNLPGRAASPTWKYHPIARVS